MNSLKLFHHLFQFVLFIIESAELVLENGCLQ
jgi:hypothetical protein